MKVKTKYKKYWYQGPAIAVTGILVLALMVFYTLSRLSLWIVSPALFPWQDFGSFLLIIFGGCRFDLSAVVMVNLPFFILINLPFNIRDKRWYRGMTGFIFVFTNSLAILANLVDSVYYRFTQKRMTGDFFNYLKAGGQDVIQLLPQYLHDFWFVAAALGVVIILLILLIRKVRYTVSTNNSLFNITKDIFLFLIVGSACVLGIRGGFQLKPIHLMTAGQYATIGHTPLVLNTPFSMIKTWNQKEIQEVKYYPSQKELENTFNPVQQGSKNRWRPYNVVIIILESFSSEHSAFLNPELEKDKYKGYTPFLDSMMSGSLVYRGYANGKRSIEGIPAILCSLPSWMNNDYITSSHAGNKINSLASLLKNKGYHTSFFHGGNNGTMNFDAFAKIAGFDRYYGRNEYNDDSDYDGEWGIYDEPFFHYFAEEMNKSPEPFFSVIFSLSSHHPYKVPPIYEGKFPKGNLEIQESIGYTDYSLKAFFAEASKMKWYDSTLFVITADHTSEGYLPFYKTRVGNYSVPVVFYQKGKGLTGFEDKTVQQLDIMPSVLDYLGYQDPYLAFGSSVFENKNHRYALSFLNNSYLLIINGKAMIWSDNNVSGYYDLIKDPEQKINLVSKGILPKDHSTDFLKAVIQQYNYRVIHNQLSMTND